MNGVLLIPCVGPMQSWGTRSRFQERDTEREPSKSGVIGMLCAALGRDREKPLDDLDGLSMGVRVDREGKLSKDFQTAQNVAVASGGSPQDLLSNRQYLSDAAFLVGLEGESSLLKSLHNALKKPVWPLSLGRKSYVPSIPFYSEDGLLERAALRDALASAPLLITEKEYDRRIKAEEQGRGDARIRLVLESAEPTHERRSDQPVSFALGKRLFHTRFVTTGYVDIRQFQPGKEVDDVPVAVGG